MHIQLTKYKIFLCTPCNPRQGLALWTTTLGLLPSLTVASAPHVENFPKPIAKQLECTDQPKWRGGFKAMVSTATMCEENESNHSFL